MIDGHHGRGNVETCNFSTCGIAGVAISLFSVVLVEHKLRARRRYGDGNAYGEYRT
jgi:hypothetical protein